MLLPRLFSVGLWLLVCVCARVCVNCIAAARQSVEKQHVKTPGPVSRPLLHRKRVDFSVTLTQCDDDGGGGGDDDDLVYDNAGTGRS